MLMGVQIRPQNSNFCPMQQSKLKSKWLKSSTLAVSKFVLCLFAKAVDFLSTKEEMAKG